MKFLLGNKGLFNIKTEESLLLLVIPIIFLSLILVSILVLPGSHFRLDLEGVNHFALKSHLLYGKHCLAYEDEKVYPGMIDTDKFNAERLQKCLGLKRDSYGVILSLEETNGEKREVKVNEQMTDRVNFCLSQGSFRCTDETIYVLIGEERKQGILKIKVIGFEK